MMDSQAEVYHGCRANSRMDNLVSVPDAARLISNKISAKTIRNWRAKGLFPCLFVKIGGKLFVDMAELDKVIAREKERAQVEADRYGLDG